MKTTNTSEYVQPTDEKPTGEKFNMLKEPNKQQEFIDHSMLAPEYMRDSNNFIMDLIDQPVEFSKDITHENALSTDMHFPNSLFSFVPKKINGTTDNPPYTMIPDEVLQASPIQKIENTNGSYTHKEQNFMPFLESSNHQAANDNAGPDQTQFPALTLLPGENDADLDETNYTVIDLVQSRCSSRKILPHKKRISRKLKAVTYNDEAPLCLNMSRQKAQAENVVNEPLTVLNNLFNCEICGHGTSSQLEFFAHLKQHYEPETSNGLIITVEKELNPACDLTNKVESSSVAEVYSDVNLNFSNFSHIENNAELESHQHLNSTLITTDVVLENHVLNSPLKDFMEVNSPLKELTDVALKDFSDVNSPLKAFSNDEFSDTEDMLEGIRSVVDKVSIEDTCDAHDGYPNIRATWFPQTLSNELHFKNSSKTCSNDNTELNIKGSLPINNFETNSQNIEMQLLQEESADLDKELLHQEIAKLHETDTVMSKKAKPSNKKRYFCTNCNKEFNSCNALKYHMRTHTGVRAHHCNICDKSFYQLTALKAHTRVHTGEKPFECEHCSRKFRQWADLKYHKESIHSKEKMYICEVCGKAFARKYSLVLHSRIHTSEKNYKCDICSQAFRASSYLVTHRRLHTGEKPHACPVCNKKFRVSGDMRRHMKVHQEPTTQAVPKTKPKPIYKTDDDDEEKVIVRYVSFCRMCTHDQSKSTTDGLALAFIISLLMCLFTLCCKPNSTKS